MLGATALYPGANEKTYLDSYLSNNDVFTVINKITEPASTVPIDQYDAKGEKVEGRMIARLNKPNLYQSRSQFIEAALTFYYLFGNSFTAEESLDNGLNAGQPVRLDQLPPQWVQINIGTVFNPVKDYSFYPMSGTVDPYPKEKIFHWKEFNPDYSYSGGHLRGMSRLHPLLKSVTGSGEAYNSLVKAFQNQGAWGILTMLGEDNKGMDLTKAQVNDLKQRFRSDSKSGKLTVSGNPTNWQKIGLTMVELEVLKALGMFKGNLADAFNVPSQLLSGSQDRTYNNYKEAERALWTNAICPSLDAYLEGLSGWLAPKFREDGNILRADYSGIEALQKNVGELIAWMVAARSFTKNEIREAAGYETLPQPEMDVIYESAGLMPLADLALPPEPALTESVMKGLSDYRTMKYNNVR
jgi:HK97 family phage portal protein